MSESGMGAAEGARYLLSPRAIRERAGQLFGLAERDGLAHFRYRPERVDVAARYVLDEIRTAYPRLDVPYHSRMRHFEMGGRDRAAELARQIGGDKIEVGRCLFELVVTSVLLDAGAGAAWHYQEDGSRDVYGRSEGLALASFAMYQSGAFSAAPAKTPWRADAAALARIDAAVVGRAFQVSERNPLLGLEGRASLLTKLGDALTRKPEFFGEEARLGRLFDYLVGQAQGGRLEARRIFETVVAAFGAIWPGRLTLGNVNLGDTWRHGKVEGPGATAGLIPFHKLSQWLSYSLVEPLEGYGITVTSLDDLTGLAEYRNGGLFIDLGVLEPKDRNAATEAHRPDSELVVEWRALTVCLLDLVAERIRAHLGLDSQSLPLAKVLQGGTWSAGRKIAKERRADGGPPISIVSDGTVF